MRTLTEMMVCLFLVLGPSLLQARALPPRAILVLEQSDVRGPFYAEVFSAMRSSVNQDSAGPVTLYVENLDLSRFDGPSYEDSLQRHLRVKYQDRPIGVIVTVGTAALEFAQRWRSTLWPGIPLVFGMVDGQTAIQFSKLSDMTGQIVQLSLKDMVTAARAVVPSLKSVVIVGDRLEKQPLFRQFRSQIATETEGLEVVDLTGMPMVDLLRRVAVLPPSSAILYTSVYSDGAGTYFPPADALEIIAQSANRPIIVVAETFLGRGGAGGYVMMPSAIGMGIAGIALRILQGESAANIPVGVGDVVKPIFDWRQLQRWSVSTSSLPPGSEVRFRPPTAWEQYRWEMIVIFLVLVTQGVLISAMMLERRRRRRAEGEASGHLAEIALLNRRSTAGELCASITHELNQPLGAILSNTEAAEAMVSSHCPDLSEVRGVLADIKRDDQRASEIIIRLRGLLTGAIPDTAELDLNEIVADVFGLLAHQAAARDIELVAFFSRDKLRVRGDRIQLEQVILNLVMNALEAMDEKSNGRREIIGRTSSLDHSAAEISIADNGPGIEAAKLNNVFRPFYTTKPGGMGMGLSITRKIVEAHGGQVWVANKSQGGAEFRLRLPLVHTKRG